MSFCPKNMFPARHRTTDTFIIVWKIHFYRPGAALCQPSPNGPRRPEYKVHSNIHNHDTRSRRGCQQKGNRHSQHEADDRNRYRTKDHTSVMFADPHSRQRREDNQAGNQERSHHPHAQHNRNRRQHSQKHIVESGTDSRGPGKNSIKGHCKDLIIKKQIQHKHNNRQHRTQHHIAFAHGQYGTEHIAVQIRIQDRKSVV